MASALEVAWPPPAVPEMRIETQSLILTAEGRQLKANIKLPKIELSLPILTLLPDIFKQSHCQTLACMRISHAITTGQTEHPRETLYLVRFFSFR